MHKKVSPEQKIGSLVGNLPYAGTAVTVDDLHNFGGPIKVTTTLLAPEVLNFTHSASPIKQGSNQVVRSADLYYTSVDHSKADRWAVQSSSQGDPTDGQPGYVVIHTKYNLDDDTQEVSRRLVRDPGTTFVALARLARLQATDINNKINEREKRLRGGYYSPGGDIISRRSVLDFAELRLASVAEALRPPVTEIETQEAISQAQTQLDEFLTQLYGPTEDRDSYDPSVDDYSNDDFEVAWSPWKRKAVIHMTRRDQDGMRFIVPVEDARIYVKKRDDAKSESDFVSLPSGLQVSEVTIHPGDFKEIRTVPETMKRLYCEHAGIERLPDDMQGVAHLLARGNKLTAMPNLPDAVEIDVSHNPVFEFPEGVYKYLERLDVTKTNISKLPAPSKVKRLRELKCTSCPDIDEIPMYRHLEKLWYGYTKAKAIPRLPRLSFLQAGRGDFRHDKATLKWLIGRIQGGQLTIKYRENGLEPEDLPDSVRYAEPPSADYRAAYERYQTPW